MKKLLVLLIILILIPSAFSFSLLDFLKNLNINLITGFVVEPDCDCGELISCPQGYICEDSVYNACQTSQDLTGLCIEAMTVSPSFLNFGNVKIGNSKDLTLTIYNIGTYPLTNINIYESSQDPVININPSTLMIAPGAYASTTITFTPTQEDTYTGIIKIENNNPHTFLNVNYLGFGISTQNECELNSGVCRDSCLSNEEINYELTPFCPTGSLGAGSVTQQYCCTCLENWYCSSWSSCINNLQTRTCIDLNNCGTTFNKPLESQSCNLPCYDNTPNNQCSINKPLYCSNGNLIENCNLCGCPSNQECINNECIQQEQSMNLAPTWFNIEDLTFSLNQLSLNNLINLNNYVIDPESQTLTITFNNNLLFFSSDIIDCYISNNMLSCNPPKKTGNINIEVKASDGEKSSTTSFQIKILQSLATSTDIVGALSNTAPLANAGPDIIAYPNQQFILDASQSYDKENNIPSISSSYMWYENQQKIGEGILLKKSYPKIGSHKIILQVTDSSGSSSTDSATIHIINKKQCKSSQTVYFPVDTKCDRKWPSKELEIININSPIHSCNLFEVCSEEIDYVIEEAIDCCDNTPLQDPKKLNACKFANQYSNKNAKKCQSLYIIKGLGSSAIYMQDYFESEMCCYAVENLCSNPLNLYTSRPTPNSQSLLNLKMMSCPNTPQNNKVGSWLSDTKIELNNMALSEVPTHVSINQLSTGTCVDYSAALTTLLRKSGYRKDEVYTVESPTHAYNLVKLPGDKKYTIVDITGNNDGLKLGSIPTGYDYCKNIQNCYNDLGKVKCPRLKEINGCENVKESLAQQTTLITQKVFYIFKDIYNKLMFEVKR